MMNRFIPNLRSALLLALLAWLPLAGGTASADAPEGTPTPVPEVRDEAHLFDAATIQQVNSVLQQIRQKYDKDLAVETFSEVPARLQTRLADEGKELFYENWIRQEARKAQTNGVFILIVQNPGRLQVGIGTVTSKKAFTPRDRDELRDLMLERFRQKKFNEAMVEGANFVLHRMDQNLGGGPMPALPALPPSAGPEAPAPPATQPGPEK